jgi:hypothetical protein
MWKREFTMETILLELRRQVNKSHLKIKSDILIVIWHVLSTRTSHNLQKDQLFLSPMDVGNPQIKGCGYYM